MKRSIDIACPKCGVPAGAQCQPRLSSRPGSHTSRIDAASKATLAEQALERKA